MNFFLEDVTPEELERIQLFRNVNLESIAGLLDSCAVKTLGGGDVLISQGQMNDKLYLILSGKVRIHIESLESAPIGIIGEGESVGELSVIDQMPTTAYVVADGPSRFLVMDEEILWSLIQASHAAAWNLLITLTKQLRQVNQVMTDDVDVEQVYKGYGTVDALTGLHNRRWLDIMLPRIIQRASTAEEPFSVLMLDIDHFREFNQQYGRLQGDRILYSMVHTITDNLRPSEWMVRYADDAFVVLIPGMDVQAAKDIAGRLHKAVMDAVPVEPDGRSVPYPTISIGIAELEVAQTPEMLLEAAETAVHQAKSSGQNQIVVLSPRREYER